MEEVIGRAIQQQLAPFRQNVDSKFVKLSQDQVNNSVIL
jgi:hypothetical protein